MCSVVAQEDRSCVRAGGPRCLATVQELVGDLFNGIFRFNTGALIPEFEQVLL
jgi:hypothetical protein